MSRELYVALAGGMAYQRQLEVVSNNLANLSTPGFKADRAVFSVESADYAAQGRVAPKRGTPEELLSSVYANLPDTYVDISAGELKHTGNPLDLALESDAFFVVQGQNGELLHTRAGNFRTAEDGTLVTADGLPVLGEKGPIRLTTPSVYVDSEGQIFDSQVAVDKLRLERFNNPGSIEKVGNGRFSAGGGTPLPATAPRVAQGALEGSNVNPVQSVVDLISVERHYESFMRVASSIDDLDKKINQRVKL